ncbi:MAG TPA: acetylxylan esterase, partial [Ramlibacter sp.]
CFGERSTVSESSASKALLWYGKSLFGQMLCEEAAALAYLSSRPDVDPTRIGALGISMGSTLSYFHAALDERIAAVAHLCCFADQRTMIELGAHDRHGIYMMVPGLLNEADAGSVAALIAPRPQLVCIGTADDLTPPLAVDRAWAELARAYNDTPAQLTVASASYFHISERCSPDQQIFASISPSGSTALRLSGTTSLKRSEACFRASR